MLNIELILNRACNMSKVRILSIDGGGIRGIIPGTILQQIEERLQKRLENPSARLVDYFDFVAGTSTGGILALAMLAPSSENPERPRYDMNEVVDLYLKRGGEIFDRNTWHKLRTAGGLLDEKYPNEALKKVLDEHFGNLYLSDLLKPCLITAYDIKSRKAKFFTQHDARKRESHDFLVKEVAQATGAAPTYFETALLSSKLGVSFPLIDGGVFANNPAMCAYAEVRSLNFSGIELPISKDMYMLSLGTGSVKEPYPYDKVKGYGMAQWIQPVIDIMMSGNSETVSYQLGKLFEAGGNKDGYVRIEPGLYNAVSAMDNASTENMNALREAGLNYVSEHDAVIEKVIDNLLAE